MESEVLNSLTESATEGYYLSLSRYTKLKKSKFAFLHKRKLERLKRKMDRYSRDISILLQERTGVK